jgi:hypothetical protein
MGVTQESWSVEGCYADWTLTVTVARPKAFEDGDMPELPVSEIQPVADHFIQTVNYVEVNRDLERMAGSGLWQLR